MSVKIEVFSFASNVFQEDPFVKKDTQEKNWNTSPPLFRIYLISLHIPLLRYFAKGEEKNEEESGDRLLKDLTIL